jgi:hypothetical protein
MSVDPSPELQRHILRTDHDGMEFELALGSFDELYALGSTLVLLAAVPATLVLVGLPAAAWFEYNVWWLVNEALMVERWLTVGAFITGLYWLLWPLLGLRRPYRRLRIERHRVVLKHPRGDLIIPTPQLAHVWVSSRGVRLEKDDGTEVSLELPGQNRRLLLELGLLIAAHTGKSGSPDTIPESLQQLRGRPVAVSSPEPPR